MAMGLWCIVSCLDIGTLGSMAEFLQESSAYISGEPLQCAQRIVQLCYPLCKLVLHGGVRCHNCGGVIFGTRFNCDQMAFQDYCVQCRYAFPLDTPFTFSTTCYLSTQEEELKSFGDKYFLPGGYPDPPLQFLEKKALIHQTVDTPQDSMQAITKVKEAVVGMAAKLKVLQLVNEPTWDTENVKTEVCIGVVSPLRDSCENVTNILLGFSLLPTNAKGLCPVEVIYKDNEYYEVGVSFMDLRDWEEREATMVAKRLNVISMESLAILRTIYGPVLSQSKQAYLSIAGSYPAFIKAHFGKTKTYQVNSIESIPSLLSHFMAPKSGTEISLWPLVTNVVIRGPKQPLIDKIRLIHLSDTSTLGYLCLCDMIYISNITDKNLATGVREILLSIQDNAIRTITYVPVNGAPLVPHATLKEVIKSTWTESLGHLQKHTFAKALGILQKPILSAQKTLICLDFDLKLVLTPAKMEYEFGVFKNHIDESMNTLKERLQSIVTLANDRLQDSAKQSLAVENIYSIVNQWAHLKNSRYFSPACRNGGKHMSFDMNRDVGARIIEACSSVWDEFTRSIQGCVLEVHIKLQALLVQLHIEENFALKPEVIKKAESEVPRWVTLEKNECAAAIISLIASSMSAFYTECRGALSPGVAELPNKAIQALQKINYEDIVNNCVKFLQSSIATISRVLLNLLDGYSVALADDLRGAEGFRGTINQLSRELEKCMPQLVYEYPPQPPPDATEQAKSKPFHERRKKKLHQAPDEANVPFESPAYSTEKSQEARPIQESPFQSHLRSLASSGGQFTSRSGRKSPPRSRTKSPRPRRKSSPRNRPRSPSRTRPRSPPRSRRNLPLRSRNRSLSRSRNRSVSRTRSPSRPRNKSRSRPKSPKRSRDRSPAYRNKSPTGSGVRSPSSSKTPKSPESLLPSVSLTPPPLSLSPLPKSNSNSLTPTHPTQSPPESSPTQSSPTSQSLPKSLLPPPDSVAACSPATSPSNATFSATPPPAASLPSTTSPAGSLPSTTSPAASPPSAAPPSVVPLSAANPAPPPAKASPSAAPSPYTTSHPAASPPPVASPLPTAFSPPSPPTPSHAPHPSLISSLNQSPLNSPLINSPPLNAPPLNPSSLNSTKNSHLPCEPSSPKSHPSNSLSPKLHSPSKSPPTAAQRTVVLAALREKQKLSFQQKRPFCDISKPPPFTCETPLHIFGMPPAKTVDEQLDSISQLYASNDPHPTHHNSPQGHPLQKPIDGQLDAISQLCASNDSLTKQALSRAQSQESPKITSETEKSLEISNKVAPLVTGSFPLPQAKDVVLQTPPTLEQNPQTHMTPTSLQQTNHQQQMLVLKLEQQQQQRVLQKQVEQRRQLLKNQSVPPHVPFPPPPPFTPPPLYAPPPQFAPQPPQQQFQQTHQPQLAPQPQFTYNSQSTPQQQLMPQPQFAPQPQPQLVSQPQVASQPQFASPPQFGPNRQQTRFQPLYPAQQFPHIQQQQQQQQQQQNIQNTSPFTPKHAGYAFRP
eukprot:Phypoly_transcript_00409.p1 GENE.Phypoly_transcript_00409~~Phypoly_transcript_00409.p1  ORF type:complete len:1618 (+),score=207.36 Phypoly_transcript_00409:355-4854(+)